MQFEVSGIFKLHFSYLNTLSFLLLGGSICLKIRIKIKIYGSFLKLWRKSMDLHFVKIDYFIKFRVIQQWKIVYLKVQCLYILVNISDGLSLSLVLSLVCLPNYIHKNIQPLSLIFQKPLITKIHFHLKNNLCGKLITLKHLTALKRFCNWGFFKIS